MKVTALLWMDLICQPHFECTSIDGGLCGGRKKKIDGKYRIHLPKVTKSVGKLAFKVIGCLCGGGFRGFLWFIGKFNIEN